MSDDAVAYLGGCLIVVALILGVSYCATDDHRRAHEIEMYKLKQQEQKK